MTEPPAKPTKPGTSQPTKQRIERVSGGQAEADKAAEDAPGERQPDEDLELRQEKLLDEAIEETFPASDPIAPKQIR